MKIPKSADYAANLRRYRGGDRQPCVVCGRPVKAPTFMVECVNGGLDECVLPGTADTTDAAYMGAFPVGPDCLRRHPELRPFVV